MYSQHNRQGTYREYSYHQSALCCRHIPVSAFEEGEDHGVADHNQYHALPGRYGAQSTLFLRVCSRDGGKAPLFPVPGCDAARCECRYQRHQDRRVEGDRRGFAGLRTDLYAAAGNPERRGDRGRRREDYNGESEKDFDFKQAGWVR